MYVTRIPTAICPPPSCCARAIARGARSSRAPSPTSPIGRRRRSRACAGCWPGRPSCRSRRALRDRPGAGARPCRRRARDGARLGLDQVSPEAGAPGETDLGHVRGADRRAGRQARDRAPAQRGDRRPLAGAVLGLSEVDEDELYAALDLLGRRQASIEKVLAQRHLKDRVLVLYDVTSSYLEGGAANSHNSATAPTIARMGRRSSSTFVHPGGLSGRRRGVRRQSRRPEHAGRSGPQAQDALSAEAHRARRRPRHHQKAHRRRPRARRLRLDHCAARAGDQGPGGRGRPPQLSLFDERDMAESSRTDIPASASSSAQPELAAERTRKRAELLEATEKALIKLLAMKSESAIRSAAGQDRPQGRRRHRPSPHGQAFRPRHHRDRPRLCAKPRRSPRKALTASM